MTLRSAPFHLDRPTTAARVATPQPLVAAHIRRPSARLARNAAALLALLALAPAAFAQQASGPSVSPPDPSDVVAGETTARVTFTLNGERGTAYLYAVAFVDPGQDRSVPSADDVIARATMISPASIGDNQVTVGGLQPSATSTREPETEHAIYLVVLPTGVAVDAVPPGFPVTVFTNVRSTRDTMPPRLIGAPRFEVSDFLVRVTFEVSEPGTAYLAANEISTFAPLTVQGLAEACDQVPDCMDAAVIQVRPLEDNVHELSGLREATAHTVYILLEDRNTQQGGLVTATVTTQARDTTDPILELSDLEVTHNGVRLSATVDEPVTLYYQVVANAEPELTPLPAARIRNETAAPPVEVTQSEVGVAQVLVWPTPLFSSAPYAIHVVAFDKAAADNRSVDARLFTTGPPPPPQPVLEILAQEPLANTITVTFRTPDGVFATGAASEQRDLSQSQVIDMGRLSGNRGSVTPNEQETYVFGGLIPDTAYTVYILLSGAGASDDLFERISISTLADPDPILTFVSPAPTAGIMDIEDTFRSSEAIRLWRAISLSETVLTIEQIQQGSALPTTGVSLTTRYLGARSLAADESLTTRYDGLDPGREYTLWYVAEDDNNQVHVARAVRTQFSPTPALRIASASGVGTQVTLSYYADRAGRVRALVTTATDGIDAQDVLNRGRSQLAALGDGSLVYPDLQPALRYTAYLYLETGVGDSPVVSATVDTVTSPVFDLLDSYLRQRHLRASLDDGFTLVTTAVHGVGAHNGAVPEFRRSVPTVAYYRRGVCADTPPAAAPVSCEPVALAENNALVLSLGENPLWWRVENYGIVDTIEQTITVVPTVNVSPAQRLSSNDGTSGLILATVTARLNGPWVGGAAPLTVGYRIVSDDSGASLQDTTGHFTFLDGGLAGSAVLQLGVAGSAADPVETVLRLESMDGLSLAADSEEPSERTRVFAGQSSQHVITTIGRSSTPRLTPRLAVFAVAASDTATATELDGIAVLRTEQAYRINLSIEARSVGDYRIFCSAQVYQDAEGERERIGSQTFCIEDEFSNEAVPIVRLLSQERYETTFLLSAPVAPGLLVFSLRVESSDSPTANLERRLLVQVAEPEAFPLGDSDQDGVLNNEEVAAWHDVDGDGLPNFVDWQPQNAYALQTQALSSSGTDFIRVGQGLRLALGPIARWTADVADPASYTPLLTLERLARYQTQLRGVAPVDLDLLDSRFGVFDFEILDVQHGGQAVVVLPLLESVPTLSGVPRMYKYRPDFGWSEFDLSGGDVVQSMAKLRGVCPAPEHVGWDDAANLGLVGGNDCLRLTITDGGPNDADRSIDGIVWDPAAIALDFSAPPAPVSDTPSLDKNFIPLATAVLAIEELATRGGCTSAPPGAASAAPLDMHWGVLLLLAAAACRRRFRSLPSA